MEIYKNTVERGQQLKICQKISDIMALRPRLYLQGSYFAQSYWAHINALEQHSMFLRSVLSQQPETLPHEILPQLYFISEV